VTRVLVTGMSGTGKSSVLEELARRGHRVVDTDDAGWTEEVPDTAGRGTERVWDEDRMGALLAEPSARSLFVAGCAPNQGRFYDRFEAVVLLSVARDILLQRVACRTANRYGKDPVERAWILEDLAAVEPLLRATATAEIDTDRPLTEVADRLEALLPPLPGFDPAP
jgi:NAD(P)-dependent dehydrogenase (short-subunit alcohol dehydrogenase family)